MSQSIVSATYSGKWDKIGYGNWSWCMSQGSKGGSNGEIGGIKLYHPDQNSDGWTEIGIGFAQFNTGAYLPDNCTIHSAYFRCSFGFNARNISGLGMARSWMAVGWRYDDGVDEYYSENLLGDPVEGYSSGTRNFPISSPDAVISKTGWSKFHFGTGNVMTRTSPGPAAPYGGNGADDFNVSGYDHATQPAQLVINWTTPPACTTGAATNINETDAYLAGTVTDYGGGTVQERGVCWSTSANPTTANSKATSGSDSMNVHATGLVKNTLYHYRAYVRTENSTQYGADQTFITDTDPTVTSVSVTDVGVIQAVGNGNVTFDGRGSVLERGFVINTTGNPTTGDTKFQSGSGTGVFSVTITGLYPGSRYYARAYCRNEVSTQYGAQIMFITPSPMAIFAGMI